MNTIAVNRAFVVGTPGKSLWLICGTLALIGLMSANPGLTVVSLLVVPVLFSLAWRPSEPPILLLLLGFQWLQVTAKVFYANLSGLPIRALALEGGSPITKAVLLGLGALLVLAAGQRIGWRSVGWPSSKALQISVLRLNIRRTFWVYAILAVSGFILTQTGIGGLAGAQVRVVLAQVKWVPLFIIAYSVVSQGRDWGWLLVAVAAEVVVGFGGYFADFKIVFFVVLVAALSPTYHTVVRKWAYAFLIAGLMFGFSVAWQGIKEEYRAYLNQGGQEQVVRVSWGQRFVVLVGLVRNLEANDIGSGLQSGLDRLAYVDFPSLVIQHVPLRTPHTEGAIWGGAVSHVLLPRFLYPGKPPLPSDSEQTFFLTGLQVASGDAGTSISVGYVAESYADFGWLAWWVPVLLMGVLQGVIYAGFAKWPRSPIVGYGLALVALLPGLAFETVSVKYLGGTLSAALVLMVLRRFVGRRFVSACEGCA